VKTRKGPVSPATSLAQLTCREHRLNPAVSSNSTVCANTAVPVVSAGHTSRLLPARAGDHLPIHRLLLEAFHGPSASEFHAQLDEPGYDPADRLLVKVGDTVAAHVRTIRRQIRIGSVVFPVVRLMDLATAREHRNRGLATELVLAAEQQSRERGDLLALTRTCAPQLFTRQGWAVAGRHVFSTAGSRQVLAQLQATSEGVIRNRELAAPYTPLQSTKPAILVRPLRRIELNEVMRLYQTSLAPWGTPLRSPEYWEWLLNRGSCDRIYVAIEGHNAEAMSHEPKRLCGAMFVREARVVELLVESGRTDVAEHLIARVCSDASELDFWQVRLDAPTGDPMHGLFAAAGGRLHEAEEVGGEVFMAKLLAPVVALETLGEQFVTRLREAEMQSSAELGLELTRGVPTRPGQVVESARLLLRFSEQGVSVERGATGRSYLSLRRRDLAPLLLGHRPLEKWIEMGQIRASSKTAKQLGAALFPQLPWWRPPLDDLLAC
jgi:predicted N-acetyltransferase YhbS